MQLDELPLVGLSLRSVDEEPREFVAVAASRMAFPEFLCASILRHEAVVPDFAGAPRLRLFLTQSACLVCTLITLDPCALLLGCALRLETGFLRQAVRFQLPPFLRELLLSCGLIRFQLRLAVGRGLGFDDLRIRSRVVASDVPNRVRLAPLNSGVGLCEQAFTLVESVAPRVYLLLEAVLLEEDAGAPEQQPNRHRPHARRPRQAHQIPDGTTARHCEGTHSVRSPPR